MPTYIVKKTHKGDKMYQHGDERTCSKNTGEKLVDSGLLYPNHVTKKEKQSFNEDNKAYIVNTGKGWFDIRREGSSVVDKKYRKKEAIAKRKEINGTA